MSSKTFRSRSELFTSLEGITIDLNKDYLLYSHTTEFTEKAREKCEYGISYGPAGVITYELAQLGYRADLEEQHIMFHFDFPFYYMKVPITNSLWDWFEPFLSREKNMWDLPNPIPEPIVIQIRDGIAIHRSLHHDNDKITINVTTDKATESPYPNEWERVEPKPDPQIFISTGPPGRVMFNSQKT